ncbi:hypothetical protein CEUSTIGMA_g8036.t1 [Chlamydomonas eustigma]|uniref:Uncharacterized protein n=1 Tax=Chlamydomonas eustigma TaxID=1157962 RepID=A0A250XBZ7_9CHLO|nr:hypothetical protein CEUSTIGMA_g8036.t1 [Chlamydomonas eustigma]|eukprot:GAX80601.1 hypothetical protein CEUSTIGMA_g8036.t1 [Chlamydomonas eustigma]
MIGNVSSMRFSSQKSLHAKKGSIRPYAAVRIPSLCVTSANMRLGVSPCVKVPQGLGKRSGLSGIPVASLKKFSSNNVVYAAAGGVASHPNEESHDAPKWTMMAKGGDMGSGSSMSATMERSKLSFVMPTPVVQSPKLDDGGSGGDIGKHNHNGGGGGDDGGDDDDYFADGDGDGEGGDGESRGEGFLRTIIPESYDKFSIAAVFAEWMRTVTDLPLIIRRAVEMGLFSSAQLVRFFSMDVRPNITRTVSRNLPPSMAREFIGRLMADPGFAQKLVLESVLAATASMVYEVRARGDKLKSELDLALINSLGMASATAATVWLLSPTRSYGAVHKFPWQQMLENLPNCVFDASGPLKQFSRQARIGSFFTKMAELSAVGAVTGTVTALASTVAVEARRRLGNDPQFQPSVSVPDIGRSSGGLAAFFALNANVRYQLIGGLDRYLFGHSNFLWTYLGITGAARIGSMAVGELSRPWWQGLPEPQQTERKQVKTSRKVSKKVSKKVPRSATAAAVNPEPGSVDAITSVAALAVSVEAMDALVTSSAPAVAVEESVSAAPHTHFVRDGMTVEPVEMSTQNMSSSNSSFSGRGGEEISQLAVAPPAAASYESSAQLDTSHLGVGGSYPESVASRASAGSSNLVMQG